MTTAQEIVLRAVGYELGELQEGSDSLSAWHQAIGLQRLNDVLRQFPTRGVGGGQMDYRTSSALEVGQPVRVLAVSDNITVTLPRDPFPGFSVGLYPQGTITLARNGWTISGTAADVAVTSAAEYYFIDGDWKLRADLAASDSSPYPEENTTDLVYILARELSGSAGFADPSAGLIERSRSAWKRMQAQYRPRLTQRADYGIDYRQDRVDILSVD
jgi:hypothetical protein